MLISRMHMHCTSKTVNQANLWCVLGMVAFLEERSLKHPVNKDAFSHDLIDHNYQLSVMIAR